MAAIQHCLKMPRPDKKFENLSREEWDFEPSKWVGDPRGDDSAKNLVYTGCSKDEAEFCYQYEFMRSQGLKSTADNAITYCPVSKRFFDLCADHFPNRPWLKIPQRERSRIINDFRCVSRNIPAWFRCSPEVFQDGLVEDVFGVDEEGVKHFTAVPFVIAWHQSNQDILKAFKQWLTANAPPENDECKIKFAGKDSRSGMITALKQLGAYRLCPDEKVAEAVAYTRQQRKDAPLYHPRRWVENARRGKKIRDRWLDPLGSFLTPEAASRLCQMLSDKNRKDLGKGKLKEWLASKITLWGLRNYLILTDSTAKSRLELVCRYGGSDEPKRVLQHRQDQKLDIGLDINGNRLSCQSAP